MRFERWKFNLYLLASMLFLCSTFQVYQMAVINNAFPAIKHWLYQQYSDRSHKYALAMWSTAAGGTILATRSAGALLGGYLADRFGRKGAFIFSSATLTLAGVMFVFCKEGPGLWVLTTTRLILSLVCGIGTVVGSLFIVEAAPQSYRGRMILFQQIFRGLGEVLGFLLSLPQIGGTRGFWPFLLVLGCLPGPVMLFLLLFVFHESPRHLMITQNDWKRAKAAVIFYQGPYVDLEAIQENMVHERMKLMEAKYRKGKERWYSGFKRFGNPAFLKLFGMAIVLNVTVIPTAFILFSTFILVEIGLEPTEAAIVTTLIGVARLITSFAMMPIVDRYDRKLITSIAVMLNAMSPFGAMVTAGLGSGFGTGFFILIFISTGGVAYSLPRNMALELFHQEDRSFANSIAMMCRFALCGFSGMIYIPVEQEIGVPWSFLPFGLLSLFCGLFIMFFVPETRNQAAFYQLGIKMDEKEERNGLSTSLDPKFLKRMSSTDNSETEALLKK